MDLERVKAIKKLSPPKSKKDIQAFMGKINFIRRFILDFMNIVRPIHHMLKFYQSFCWNTTAKTTFKQIKDSISLYPTLETPNFTKYFIIHTSATKEVISAILLQKNEEGIEQPISFISHSLSDVTLKYYFIEKHAYSLVKAIEKIVLIILGKNIEVRTPFPVVKFQLSQNLLSWKLAHWLVDIQEHGFTITTSMTIKV